MTKDVLETAARSVRARQRIRPFIYETPLIPSRTIGHQTSSTVLFKAENLQLTGSFKIRGAVSRMTSLPRDQRVITASSGNHGIGAAHAASAIGQKLTVVLPEIIKSAKLERIRSYGVDVILHGAETGLAEQHAQGLAASEKLAYVSQMKAAEAQREGRLRDEIVPVKTPDGIVDQDGTLRPGTTLEGLAGLKPAFRADGSVTAGTSSPLTDGAAMTLITSEDYAKRHGLDILGRIRSVALARPWRDR